MYFKSVLAVLFFVSLTLIDGLGCPKHSCSKPGEIYTSCGSCDGTCDNPEPICLTVCNTGCFCSKDLVRDSAGNCINPDKCP